MELSKWNYEIRELAHESRVESTQLAHELLPTQSHLNSLAAPTRC